VLDNLPIIKGMRKVNDEVKDFRLMEGFSAETSGGIMMMIS